MVRPSPDACLLFFPHEDCTRPDEAKPPAEKSVSYAPRARTARAQTHSSSVRRRVTRGRSCMTDGQCQSRRRKTSVRPKVSRLTPSLLASRMACASCAELTMPKYESVAATKRDDGDQRSASCSDGKTAGPPLTHGRTVAALPPSWRPPETAGRRRVSAQVQRGRPGCERATRRGADLKGGGSCGVCVELAGCEDGAARV